MIVHHGDALGSLHRSRARIRLHGSELNPCHRLSFLGQVETDVSTSGVALDVDDDVVLAALCIVVELVLYGDVGGSSCRGDREQACIIARIIVRALLEDELLHHHVAGHADGVVVAVHLEVLVVAVETGGSERVDAVGPYAVLACSLVVFDVDSFLIASSGIYVYII